MLTAKKKINLVKLSHLFSTGFGSGMIPIIPGTCGSIVATVLWCMLINLSLITYLLVIVFTLILGSFFCHKTCKDIGVHDHRCIVLDEFVGVWITLIVLPVINWFLVFIGFILFRIIDIWKPWPIYWIDKNIKGGIGVMIDDVAAGVIASVILYFIKCFY